MRRRIFGFVFNFIVVMGVLYGLFAIADNVRHSQGFHDAMMWVAATFTGAQILALAVVIYVLGALATWAIWVHNSKCDDIPLEGRGKLTPSKPTEREDATGVDVLPRSVK